MSRKKKPKTESPAEEVSTEPELSEEELEFLAREAALISSVTSRFGKTALRRASEVPDVFRLRRPTGIPSLDLELHGGFPAGGISQIIGEDGIGKTDLCWRCLRQQQIIQGPRYRGAMICVEMQPDFSQARFAGLKIPYTEEEVYWLHQDYPEDLVKTLIEDQQAEGDTLFPVGKTAEEALDIAASILESGLFQLIVVDSIGAIQPSNMTDRELGDGAVVATKANVITNFMGKVWSYYNQPLSTGGYNETSILVLNQYREKVEMGSAMGRDLRIGGGRALKHGKLTDLFLRRTAWIREGDNKLIVGKRVAAEILKGKAGIHEGAVATWDFRHSMGVDIGASLIELGMANEQIQKSGAWYSMGTTRLGQGASNAGQNVLTLRQEIMEEAFKRRKIPSFRIR